MYQNCQNIFANHSLCGEALNEHGCAIYYMLPLRSKHAGAAVCFPVSLDVLHSIAVRQRVRRNC